MSSQSRVHKLSLLLFVLLVLGGAIATAQTNVLTYRNDIMRTAQNLTETVLTPANVQFNTFGLLGTFPVDGVVDAQPLVVSGLTIGNMQSRNVVFVATENDSLYAFDANTRATYWKTSLVGVGETASDNRGCSLVSPSIGITSTPVIDLHAGPHGTIFAVAMTKDSGGVYHDRLHAIDITTGAEQFNGPMEIQATYPGTGPNSINGNVIFDPGQYVDRTALLLVNGVIYTSWASHCDIPPYNSWTMGYNETTLAQTSVFNFTPNGTEGGIWGSGGGVSADLDGNLYFAIGNGTFDTTLNSSGFPSQGDYGNAFVKMSLVNGVLAPVDYWTMDNTTAESTADEDLGSGGILVLPDLIDSNGKVRHLATGAGKDRNLYVFDRDNMGKFDSANNSTLYQELPGIFAYDPSAPANGVFSSPAWFNGNLYYGAVDDVIRSFPMIQARLGSAPTSTSPTSFFYPGTSPSISANGTANAILWAYEDGQINNATVALHAYDANNLGTELYNSNQAASGRDNFGTRNKFMTPTIANGEVFVGTPNSVAIFGLLPNVTLSPSSVSFQNQIVNTASTAQMVTLTNSGPNALTVGSIAITGANPGDFGQTNNCPTSPTTIPAQGSCTINVTFKPTALNMRDATITITDNGAGNPQTVGLSGTGVASQPTVSLKPSTITFPNQTVNTTSAAQSTTLTNNGPGTLTITSITITGSNPGDFAQTNNCPLSPNTIAVNGACQINVTFTPTVAGSRSAAISITDNSAGSPQPVAVSGTGTASSSQSWPNGYNYEATFTVAAGQVPSAQTNFPALISGTFPDFATTANGGRVFNTCTQTVGNNATPVPCDLIFTSDAAGATLLNWEFETWSAATGAVNIWVNAPNLNNGTTIYAWYGQSAVSTLQTTPSAAWSSNFMAVYHLKENPSGPAPQLNDSTSNANHATMNGAVAAGQQQAGQIDGSVNFEGDTWASLANSANFSFERTDSFSLSFWVKIPSNSTATLLSKLADNANGGWALLQFGGGNLALALVGTGLNNQAIGETPAVTSGVWHHVVATYSGTSTVAGMQIYIDGVNQPLTALSNTLTTSIVNALNPVIDGRSGGGAESSDSLDEIRISTKGVVFSPGWVSASFNNQSRPQAFFTLATGLTNPGGSLSAAPSSVTFPNQTVNTMSTAQAVTLTNNGPGAAAITGITITGSNPADFAQTNTCPMSPNTLGANGTCQINVTFKPTAAGSRSATITIAGNGIGSIQPVGLSGTGTAAYIQPWPNAYTYQATFTVAAGQVSSAQTNLPALISGTFPDFATTANGGRVFNTCTQTVGNNATPVPCDLIFTSDAAGTTLLSWEFETWSAATGAVNIWVNAPNLNSGTTIYAWYGRPSVTTLQTTPSATWSSDFMAVYHLKESPSGPAPQLNDSTSNANHATMNGTVAAGQQQAGQIDGSVNFEGDTWASLANPANFSFERTDSFSLSFWVKIPSNSTATLLSKLADNANGGWALLQFGGGNLALALVGTGLNNQAIGETPALTSGVWHHVVATYSGTSTVAGMQIYIDGVNQPLTALSNTLTTSIMNALNPAIDGRAGGGAESSDSLDEIRISTKGVVFSPGWVTASFNNQSHPQAFFTVATGLTSSGH